MLLLQIIWRQVMMNLTRLSPDFFLRGAAVFVCGLLGLVVLSYHAIAGEIRIIKPIEAQLQVQARWKSYYFQIAHNELEAQQGLMYRTSLPPRTGMAFPFDKPQLAVFWMKNTLIPLDMIFVRNQSIVRILENVPPCPVAQTDQCPLYSSIVPVDWVLELPAGTVKTDRLKKNQHLKFKNLSD